MRYPLPCPLVVRALISVPGHMKRATPLGLESPWTSLVHAHPFITLSGIPTKIKQIIGKINMETLLTK